MRMKWLLLAAFLMFAPVARAYESRGVETPPKLLQDSVVQRGHWTYEALQILESVRVEDMPLIDGLPKKELQRKLTDAQTRLTRYEVAFIIVRMIETLLEQPLIKASTPPNLRAVERLPLQSVTAADPKLTPEMLRDLISALRREYANELALLGLRDYDFLSPVAKPPRMTITPSLLNPRTYIFSPTFAEILTRVAKRDEATGAIITVRRKTDAPQNQAGTANILPDLNFSLTETDDGKNVIIVLSDKIGAGANVYERYILRMDNAMRKELNLQKQMQAAQKTAPK